MVSVARGASGVCQTLSLQKARSRASRLVTTVVLGLSYDPRMLRYHEKRVINGTGLDAKGAWLPITAGLRDWRSRMPVADVECFEAATGDLLDELGYPPRPATTGAGREIPRRFDQTGLRTRLEIPR